MKITLNNQAIYDTWTGLRHYFIDCGSLIGCYESSFSVLRNGLFYRISSQDDWYSVYFAGKLVAHYHSHCYQSSKYLAEVMISDMETYEDRLKQ